MFTKRVTIFRLLGIDVKLDASWLFLAVLLTWTLGANVFPQSFPDRTAGVYWLMGAGGAVGLFMSIIAHEFGHAIVARRFGIPIEDITLFLFGGVARMSREPDRARDEFLMAIAGPIVSVLIAVGCYGLLGAFGATDVFTHLASPSAGQSVDATPLEAVLAYLALVNGILAVFNMVPAFPLDGGRVFRAAMWGIQGDIRAATRVASAVGSGFGWFMMFMGVLTFFSGGIVAGMWWFILGLFVKGASAQSYQHVLLKSSLGGRPVSRFMSRSPVVVPPDISLRSFVEDYVYAKHHKLYPVGDERGISAAVNVSKLKDTPIAEWDQIRVREIAEPLSDVNTVPGNVDAMEVLQKMNESGVGRMLVAENGHIAGVIVLKDLLDYLTLRMSLEPDR